MRDLLRGLSLGTGASLPSVMMSEKEPETQRPPEEGRAALRGRWAGGKDAVRPGTTKPAAVECSQIREQMEGFAVG